MKNLLVIPAFNEEPSLPGLIAEAKKHIPDILVVDDGSSDATTLVSGLAGAMVHRFRVNAGKGEALKSAFSYAVDQGYDFVLTMDGDGRHDPSDIPNFFPLLDSCDLVLGYRVGEPGSVPIVQRLANRSASLIISVLSGQRIYDSQTGFRAYGIDLLRRIQLQSRKYDLESEVIIKAARKGFRIGHSPVQTFYTGGVGRLHDIRDSARFCLVVVKSFFWW